MFLFRMLVLDRLELCFYDTGNAVLHVTTLLKLAGVAHKVDDASDGYNKSVPISTYIALDRTSGRAAAMPSGLHKIKR